MEKKISHNFSVFSAYFALNNEISIICKQKVITDTELKSFLYRNKSKGPNIDRCGTHHVTFFRKEYCSLHFTLCCLLYK